MRASGTCSAFPTTGNWCPPARKAPTSLSAFDTRPEQTTQFDTGVVYSGERLSASVSAFYSDVDDYILIETGYRKGARSVTVTRNVDARTWGGEADATLALAPHWQLVTTLAYTRGENDTDDLPLAQMPPLELRTGLDYSRAGWSAGLLWRAGDGTGPLRAAAGQHRGPGPRAAPAASACCR